jgi:hypothetical protein
VNPDCDSELMSGLFEKRMGGMRKVLQQRLKLPDSVFEKVFHALEPTQLAHSFLIHLSSFRWNRSRFP